MAVKSKSVLRGRQRFSDNRFGFPFFYPEVSSPSRPAFHAVHNTFRPILFDCQYVVLPFCRKELSSIPLHKPKTLFTFAPEHQNRYLTERYHNRHCLSSLLYNKGVSGLRRNFGFSASFSVLYLVSSDILLTHTHTHTHTHTGATGVTTP